MRPPLLACLGLPFLALALLAGPTAAASRPVVVELFTSQSCSSCPPAEALLKELAAERADLLPLAFHVTYWNHLDWRDTVSLPAATERQKAYAAQFGGDSVFTPQVVVDGRRSIVGSRRDAVGNAIVEARGEAREAATLDLTRNGDALVVRVGAGSGAGRLLLVGFDHEHRTKVARGENAGREITQANVVRSIRSVGEWTGTAKSWSEPVPLGADAALLLQASDGRILGAARLAKAGS